MNRPDKFAAELVHGFHETVKKGEGVKYEDYTMIGRIQKEDIPKLKTDLQSEVDRIASINRGKNPQEIEAAQAEWKKLLASLVALETSWKAGQLKIEKHRDEVYEKTKELTKAKLSELFGEVSGNVAQAPEGVKKLEAKDFVDTALSLLDKPDEFKKHLATIDGKIDQKSKDTLLSYIDDAIRTEGNPGKRSRLQKVREQLAQVKLKNQVEGGAPAVAGSPVETTNGAEKLVSSVQKRLNDYASQKGYSAVKFEGTSRYAKSGDTSFVQEYKVTLFKKVNVAGVSFESKPLIIDGIFLEGAELSKLKTEDDLFKEITTKIEGAVKPSEVILPTKPETQIIEAGNVPEKVSKFGITKEHIALLQSYGLKVEFTPEWENGGSGSNDSIEIRLIDGNNLNYKDGQGNIRNISSIPLPSNRSNVPKYKNLKIEKQQVPGGDEKLYIEYGESGGASFKHYIDKPKTPIATERDNSAPAASQGGVPEVADRAARAKKYNEDFLKKEGQELNDIISPKRLPDAIQNALKKYIDNPSYANADALQNLVEGAPYKKSVGKHGFVGPMTLKALLEIWKGEPEKPASVQPARTEAPVDAREVLRKGIIAQAEKFMDDRLGMNGYRMDDQLVFRYGGGTYGFQRNPFSEVILSSDSKKFRGGDLQMRVNIMTAYEGVLKGPSLDAWRKLSSEEKGKIIAELDATWNKKAQEKVNELNKKK